MIERHIQALTFDCYGTLIDWETGILTAFARTFGADRIAREREPVLRLYAAHEREIEAGPYRPYREVLAEVTRRMALDLGTTLKPGDDRALADSIRDWPAFDETPRALAMLKRRFRLAVLSNIDDDLFEGSRPRLGVELDALVTAQQVRSYKPGRVHFDEGLRRLGLRPDQVLHVAESRYHDVAPARAIGFHTVWINRHATGNASASGESAAQADLVVNSLTGLVEALSR